MRDDLPAGRRIIHLVQPDKIEPVGEGGALGRRVVLQQLPQPKRISVRFFLFLIAVIVVVPISIWGSISIAYLNKVPSENSLRESNKALLADITKVVTSQPPQTVAVPIDAKISPELAASIRQEVAATVRETGLVIARDAPIVKKLEAEKAAQQKMIDGLSRKKTEAEAKVARLEAKNSELESRLDLTQQKLENATSQGERDQIMKDAVTNLSPDDLEALMNYQKLAGPESSGRPLVYGPWVPVKILVQKKDWRGRPVKNKEGKSVYERVFKLAKVHGCNPWNIIRGGVCYDRGYGPVQMMGDNIPEWSFEATGIRYTPDQLMREATVGWCRKNPTDTEVCPNTYRKVGTHRVKFLLAKYGHRQEDLYAAWHSNMSLAEAMKHNAKDVNMFTSDYVKNVKASDPADPKVHRNARRNN